MHKESGSAKTAKRFPAVPSTILFMDRGKTSPSGKRQALANSLIAIGVQINSSGQRDLKVRNSITNENIFMILREADIICPLLETPSFTSSTLLQSRGKRQQ